MLRGSHRVHTSLRALLSSRMHIFLMFSLPFSPIPSFAGHRSTYFPSKMNNLHPLCDQILSLPPPPPPDYGTIRKVLSPLNLSTGSCLLEEIELFPPRKRQPIRSLLILHSRSELYVGVRDQVIKIPLKRCSYHKSRE